MKNEVRVKVFISLIVILILVGFKITKQIDDNKSVEAVKEDYVKLINLSDEVYQDDIYILPEEIELLEKGVIINDKVVWDKIAHTDTPGKYMYEGYTEIYNYGVNLILKVKENVYDRKVGYIRNIYIDSNKDMSIEFDTVEFYRGEEAVNEAIKDNEVERDEHGNIINQREYYVRNSNYEKEIYKINKFPVLELIEIEINDKQRGSGKLVNVDFEGLKKYIETYNNCDDEDKLLFYMDLKNNEVMAIVRQYLKYN